MTVIQQAHKIVEIPDAVRDLASFRRWAKSPDFPDRGWYAHLDGQLWVDPSMESGAHNKLKTKFATVLTLLVERMQIGDYYGDR